MKKLLVRTVVAFVLGTIAISLPPTSTAAASSQEDETISAVKIENARLREQNAILRERVQLLKENQALRATLQDQDQPSPAKQPIPAKQPNSRMQATQAAEFAYAADLPTKAPKVLSVYNTWGGFYIGGNAGYGWHDPSASFTGNDVGATFFTCGGAAGGTCPPPASFNISGGLGGLQAGYNWQLSPKTLIGLETDFDFSRIRGTGTSNFNLLAPSNFTADQNVKWFGTVRARFGYLPTDRLLAYATAGFAYGRVEQSVALNSFAGNNVSIAGPTGVLAFTCTTGPNCFLGSSSRTATGWTAGGGVEYAAWNNLSLKAEYLYVNLGGGNNVNVVAQNAFGFIPISFTAAYSRVDFHVVRAGINYRF